MVKKRPKRSLLGFAALALFGCAPDFEVTPLQLRTRRVGDVVYVQGRFDVINSTTSVLMKPVTFALAGSGGTSVMAPSATLRVELGRTCQCPSTQFPVPPTASTGETFVATVTVDGVARREALDLDAVRALDCVCTPP